MNKDLDERIVPNGQYRDAMNIQISTSDSGIDGLGNVGTVQNLKGNIQQILSSTKRATGTTDLRYELFGNNPRIVGGTSDESKNAAYFFIAAPLQPGWNDGTVEGGILGIDPQVIADDPVGEKIFIDRIVRCISGENDQVNYAQEKYEHVFIDRFGLMYSKRKLLNLDANGDILNSIANPTYFLNGARSTPSDGYDQIKLVSGSDMNGFRVGMRMYAQSTSGNYLIDGNDENNYVTIVNIDVADEKLTLSERIETDLNTTIGFKFIAPRVLEFDYFSGDEYNPPNIIPTASINIIDDLLMWSDGKHEPKKLNIKRSIAGTSSQPVDATDGSGTFSIPENLYHTKLYVTDPRVKDLVIISDIEPVNVFGANGLSDDVLPHNITVIKKAPRHQVKFELIDFDRKGEDNFPLNNYQFVLDTDGDGVGDKKPRIGSNREITFPSFFEKRSSDVYSFTAANTDKEIVLRGQIVDFPDEDNPDVVSIRILSVDKDLKPSRNPSNWNVQLERRDPIFENKFGRFAIRYLYEDNEYSSFSPWSDLAFLPGDFSYTAEQGFNNGMRNQARQIKLSNFIPYPYVRPLDVKAIDILWKTTNDQNCYIVKTITREIDPEFSDWIVNGTTSTGELTITSELIHKVVESNQVLRSWDNVPRYARAQGITGNRLVFGNYVQGYDIDSNIGLDQTIVSDPVLFPTPKKSVKSMRTYQWGMVFGDEYGRETPVITNGIKSEDGQLLPGSSKTLKRTSEFSNRFKLTQKWDGSDPSDLDWIKYVKYYVKETSNEYYNLVLDRWYNAGEGNVWLSFNSADRNKVDEETFLILKNQHSSQVPVADSSKYKIMAIESEAPDFIKIDIRKFNKKRLGSDYVWGTDGSGNVNNVSDALPAPLIDTDFLEVQNAVNLDKYTFDGIPKVRIIARYTAADGSKKQAETEYRTVTNLDNTTGQKGISIREPFTESELDLYNKILVKLDDASEFPQNTADTQNNSGSLDFKWFFQLADFVTENKSEFDGKFFVKIAKDASLKENVLGARTGEYEVLNSFQIAQISATATNPADDDNEYAGEMDFESASWETIGGITNSSVTSVFSGDNFDSDASDTYWTNWYNNASRTADIFIDAIPAFSDFNFDDFSSFDNQAMQYLNSGYEPLNGTGDDANWEPKGLSNGSFTDNTKGQLTFSVVHGDDDPWIGVNSYFKAKMETPGTLFRFRDDPNQSVYEVFKIIQTVDEGGTIQGPVQISSRNYDDDGNPDYINRNSLIVRFRLVDNNLQQQGQGIDTSIWDPRGTIKHNGLGSLTLEIVDKVSSSGDIEDAIVSTSACFETEPKEDIGLDIYYEASRAFPMYLDSSTIRDYVGAHFKRELASKFSIEHRALSSVNELHSDFGLDDTSYVKSVFGEDSIQVRKITTGNDSALTPFQYIQPSTGEVHDIFYPAIDDVVAFTDKNGTQTRAIVKDHVKLDPVAVIPVPADIISVGNCQIYNGVHTNGLNYGFVTLPSANANITVGMEVTSGGQIDKGTFVTEVNGDSIRLNNQVEIQNASTTVKFHETTGSFRLHRQVWSRKIILGWNNCYSFGNGVESDRISDDFNAPQIDNGFKVSATFLNYGEENISSGMIYSGLYNSTSSVNNLSEFNMAEKITKNLNTSYGSIQAMKARDNDVVVFTEDKVLRVLSSGKDALFNADGNAQLTATDKVLGTAMPFAGDYGISKNPESLATDAYRMYFTDKQRGAVLRLSRDGITPISDIGMKSYFRENLKNHSHLVGSFDGVNDEYNLMLQGATALNSNSKMISFNEPSKGWVSFKSFTPIVAVGVGDKYYSCNDDEVYKHYSDDVERNSFYGSTMSSVSNASTESEIELIFNQGPSSIKSFKALNYEGTQAKVDVYTGSTETDVAGNSISANDQEYYNLTAKSGWYVDSIITDQQEGSVNEFIDKEKKWFNYIKGVTTTFTNKFENVSGEVVNVGIDTNNVDTSEFSVQGIGFPLTNPTDTQTEATVVIQPVNIDEVGYSNEQNKPL